MAPRTFEEVLRVLHGQVGGSVVISYSGPDGELVGSYRGTLQSHGDQQTSEQA